MKKTIIVLTAILICTGIVFAEGSKEEDSYSPGPGRGNAAPWGSDRAPFAEAEELTVTGTLILSDYGPVLDAGDVEYLLMVPRILPEGISVDSGDEITVTGYAHDTFMRPRWGFTVDESKKIMGVTMVVIDGEEFEIPRPMWSGSGFGDCPYGAGRFGGRHMRGGMYPGRGWSGDEWGQGGYGGRGRGMYGHMGGRGPRF